MFPAFALSYYSHMKGLKIELGSDRVLGIPLDTYIPSEQVAIEVNSGSEDMEILKEHLCQQRGIKRIKLPMKSNETESRLCSAYQSSLSKRTYIYYFRYGRRCRDNQKRI